MDTSSHVALRTIIRTMRPVTHAVGAAWRGLILLVIAVIVSAIAFAGLPDQAIGFDLVQVYVPAGERVLDGESPFPAVDDPVLRQNAAYVYPPLAALLAFPSRRCRNPGCRSSACSGRLRSSGRDLAARRARSAVLRRLRPLAADDTGLAERQPHRARRARLRPRLAVSGLVAQRRFVDGIGIALKLLLWPLVVWLLATRRVWAAWVAVWFTAVRVLLTWAVIDFEGLLAYPALLERLTEIETVNTPGVSIYSGVIELGAALGRGPRVCSRRRSPAARRLRRLRAQR